MSSKVEKLRSTLSLRDREATQVCKVLHVNTHFPLISGLQNPLPHIRNMSTCDEPLKRNRNHNQSVIIHIPSQAPDPTRRKSKHLMSLATLTVEQLIFSQQHYSTRMTQRHKYLMSLTTLMIQQLILPRKLTATVLVKTRIAGGIWIVRSGMTVSVCEARVALHATCAVVTGNVLAGCSDWCGC